MNRKDKDLKKVGVRKMGSLDIQMQEGVLSGEKVDELTKFIINKFAEEKMNRDEAVEVLKNVNNVIGEFAMVKHTNQRFLDYLFETESDGSEKKVG